MFSPEMMKQAQNMMANMSPEVRLRGGRRPVGCFGPWIYCGDVFFFSGTEKETGEQGVDEDLIVKDG